MGKKSGGGSAQMPSPSEYIPLVNAQAQANRVNTYTPYGSTVFSPVSSGGALPSVSPTSGGGNQAGHAMVTNQNRVGRGGIPVNNLPGKFGGGAGYRTGGQAGRGGKMSGMQNLADSAGTGVTPMQSVTTFSPELQRIFDHQTSLAGAPMTGENFNQDIEQATFKRQMALLEPGMQQQMRDFEQQMANRGLPVGGEAYDKEFSNISRSQNAAREQAALAAVLAGSDAAARERGLRLSERGQQFNEMGSILGQNQVAPTAPVDVMGAANMAMNRNLANQQANSGKKSSMTNAGATLGAAYLMSDRRLKENEEKVGEYLPGISVYLCNFKGKLQKMLCFMADEVEKVFPAAVVTRSDGFKMVNYGFLLGGRGEVAYGTDVYAV